jgi:hypothetical protein
MGHPTIAIADKVQNDFLDGITQCNLFDPLGWRNLTMVPLIVPSAIDL